MDGAFGFAWGKAIEGLYNLEVRPRHDPRQVHYL